MTERRSAPAASRTSGSSRTANGGSIATCGTSASSLSCCGSRSTWTVVRNGRAGRGGPSARDRARAVSGQRLLEQREQTAPGALGLLLVVDVGVGHAPTVRGGVYLDLGVETRVGEALPEHVLRLRLALVVVLRDRDQEARLHLRNQQVRAVRLIRHEPAAVERRGGADAIGQRGRGAHYDRAAHAVARRA